LAFLEAFFAKVYFVCLIKGHTKNPCHHVFIALNRLYRANNINTFKDLIGIINKSDYAVAREFTLEDFNNISSTSNWQPSQSEHSKCRLLKHN
jgi:hypothetical protein